MACYPPDMKRLLLVALLALPGAPAMAQAKTAKDCEPIKNPMEFNLCLASLSPVRGSHTRATAPPPGAEENQGRAGGKVVAPRHRGRVSTTIGGRSSGGSGHFMQDGKRYFRYPGGLVVSDAPRGRKQMSFDVKRR